MRLEIGDNPNTRGCDEFVFAELGAPRALKAIRVDGPDPVCDVAGVGEGGRFVTAYAMKVTDSSDGFAWLIYGGEWGIRLRPRKTAGPWDLKDTKQWGEPFKLYGSEEDLVYE